VIETIRSTVGTATMLAAGVVPAGLPAAVVDGDVVEPDPPLAVVPPVTAVGEMPLMLGAMVGVGTVEACAINVPVVVVPLPVRPAGAPLNKLFAAATPAASRTSATTMKDGV
jgi:hypothetical protein